MKEGLGSNSSNSLKHYDNRKAERRGGQVIHSSSSVEIQRSEDETTKIII